MDDFSSIGFYLPDGLPNKEYAISDGTVSVILDQSGGINLIEYQGPRRTDGARRGAFYSNGIWRREDFFPEPVISFQVSDRERTEAVPFRDVSLCPFGISSKFEALGRKCELRIWIRGTAVLIEFAGLGAPGVSFTVVVREAFTEHHNDHSPWDEPYLDERLSALRYDLRRNFTMASAGKNTPTEHRHEACSMIACLSPAKCRRADGVAELSADVPPDGNCRLAIVFGEDVRRVEWLLLEAKRDHESWLGEQLTTYRELAGRVPRLETDERSGLPEIIRVAPLFARSTRRERSTEEVAFRASTRGYGLWNGWDGQWACRLLDACGEDDSSRRFLNFLEASRGPNGAVTVQVDYDFGPVHDANYHTPPADRHFGDGWNIFLDACAIVNVHEYFFRTGDRAQLEKSYPSIARVLRTTHSNASPLGLVESCFSGADYSVQINRPQLEDPRDNRTLSSRFSGVEDAGHLFNACHLGAELAGLMGDSETLELCADLIRRIEVNFMDLFFDQEKGFLIDCVWPKNDPVNKNRTFKLLSLLSLSGYGELLTLGEWARMADFAMDQFTHPVIGLQYVARDQAVHESGARFKELWLQNSAREVLKLARLSGNTELLARQLDKFEEHFRQERVVREDLYNKQRPDYFQVGKAHVSTSWWQNMTASAWWHGILESFAGIRWERGLLEYVPGDGGADVRISNLHRGPHCWDLEVTGRGPWIESMTINGAQRVGTYQLLPEGDAREQKVRIRKTAEPPSYPVILSAGASPLSIISAEPNHLAATVHSPGFTRLWFYSPERPRVVVAGEEMDFRWAEGQGTLALMGRGDLALEMSY